jgi:hypothetical protein
MLDDKNVISFTVGKSPKGALWFANRVNTNPIIPLFYRIGSATQIMVTKVATRLVAPTRYLLEPVWALKVSIIRVCDEVSFVFSLKIKRRKLSCCF